MELMQKIFDFDVIKALIDGGFKVTANALHGGRLTSIRAMLTVELANQIHKYGFP